MPGTPDACFAKGDCGISEVVACRGGGASAILSSPDASSSLLSTPAPTHTLLTQIQHLCRARCCIS